MLVIVFKDYGLEQEVIQTQEASWRPRPMRVKNLQSLEKLFIGFFKMKLKISFLFYFWL